MIKTLFKEKPWFAGGLVGVLYFLLTLLIDYWQGCTPFKADGMCGMLVGLLNFPSLIILEVVIRPNLFPLSVQSELGLLGSVIELGSIVILNFIVGAIIFTLIAKLWKRSSNT